MPRIYTEAAYKADNLLLADAYNKELQTAIEQLNGQLDGHNLPLRSVGYLRTVQQTIGGGFGTLNSIGTFNDFYTIEPLSDTVSFDGASGKGASWTSISGLSIGTSLTAGSINGSVCLTVDKPVTVDAVTSAEFGKESTYKIGVFINDILIAETGEIGVGVFTVDLPFAANVGSQYYTVSARIWINNRPTSVVNDHLDTTVDWRHMWFRNQKR